MNNEDIIRNRIGDKPKTEIERYQGNGVITGFDIHNDGAYDFVITFDDEAVDPSLYEYHDDLSRVIFTTAPDNEVIVAIKYKYAAFTDAELTALLTSAGNNVDKATAEALRQALGDQAKMVSFQHGDRSVSLTDIFKNLMSLLDSYEKRITNDGANSGGSFVIGKRTLDQGHKPQVDDLSRLLNDEGGW
jgi:hypothetical protein